MSMERVPPLSLFEESIQRRLLVDRLREIEENEIVTYSALSALIGDDVQEGGRHYLASAREKLAKEGYVFDAVVNVGVKRLDPIGIVAATDNYLGKSVNAVVRAKRTLHVADYERLPDEEKKRYGIAQLRIGIAQQFSRRKALNRLKGIVDVQASLPKMRAALAGVLNQFGGA